MPFEEGGDGAGFWAEVETGERNDRCNRDQGNKLWGHGGSVFVNELLRPHAVLCCAAQGLLLHKFGKVLIYSRQGLVSKPAAARCEHFVDVTSFKGAFIITLKLHLFAA